ncbi:MAG TPA: hypothetical protein VLQ45_08370 [Thermoanaerobaculia bacterium]|nr:hypothetical protein [Thermoanaerobaculia bacterium]
MTSRLNASRRLAYVLGVLTPLGETFRRWGTWWDHPLIFIDDYLIGAFLIAGAWATRGLPSNRGRALLAAAWGFTLGMAYASVAAHWQGMQVGFIDPAPIPTEWVFAIKVAGCLIAAGALLLTIADIDTTGGREPGSSSR